MKATGYLILISALVLSGAMLLRHRSGEVSISQTLPHEGRRQVKRPQEKGLREVALEAVGRTDREAFLEVFGRLVKLDPREAAGLLAQAGAFREEALRVLMQAWTARDQEEAHAWALEQGKGEEREIALNYVYFAVAEADPAKAVELAAGDGLGDGKGTLRNLGQQWASRDFEAAKAWAEGLPKGPERDQICGRMAMVRAATEPEEAATWVVGSIPEGPMQDEAILSVLNRWLERDAVAAETWIQGFPDNDLKTRALAEMEGRK